MELNAWDILLHGNDLTPAEIPEKKNNKQRPLEADLYKASAGVCEIDGVGTKDIRQ